MLKVSFVDHVISHVVQPVLGHHQDNHECTTRELMLALHLYHVCYQRNASQIHMIESHSFSIWKNLMLGLCFYELLQYFKYEISVGSEN